MNSHIQSTSNTLNIKLKGKTMTFTILPEWSFALIIAATLCIPSTAQADKVAANADFVSSSTDGCTDIEVNIFVKRGQLKKKSGSKKSKLTMSLTKIDTCKGHVLVSAEAKNVNLKGKAFTVTDGKATLDTTIKMFNRRTKNKFTVDVSVQWVTDGTPVIADITREMTTPGRFVTLPTKAQKTLYLANAHGFISDGNNVFIKDQAEEASFMITR